MARKRGGVKAAKAIVCWLVVVCMLCFIINLNASRGNELLINQPVQTTSFSGTGASDPVEPAAVESVEVKTEPPQATPPPPPPPSPVKAVAVPVEAGSACVSELKVDVPTAQCQTFCNALFKKHHCKWCKCRACAFCAEGTPPAENNTATTSPPPPSPSPTPSPAESNASLDLHANPLALEGS
eukprot:CAMPEP_0205880106 /NCGR_PEP_ID=MMETSP1083-20121108/15762_1 /ASSEMBLY_ACC=CAM_ASM_000430 /TAXON_ID=97485 /ORGANISM="Prymnesium parvum, Strain Texoma1" /LENGTH=182 /DNA_ID=CAMNT_0053243127 /DNA_START=165 /DNA_END=710 /DNA_ORIENTATION=+